MARALRRASLTVALPALVGLSTLLHWLAGRRITGLWIMPDEVIYADRGLGLWRHLSLPILNGQGAGYSVLYPVVAGLPLSFGSLARGYASLKLLQALVASLAAVPVFMYGRRLMPPAYALLAAALTLSSPLLLYSGFVMTEVVYYPVAALAVLATAHAVATTRLRDQLVALALIAAAVATRVQAIVLVGVFAGGVLLDAVMARDARRVRRFWPIWALLALVAVAVAASPGLFGAYAGAFSRGYPLGASVRLVYYHLAYIVLLVAVAPILAASVLVVQAVRGKEHDPGARALLAVTAMTVLLVSMQVGVFAARYAPHLLGRDLAAVPPPLFLVFALWVARGTPRPFVVAAASVLGIAAVVLAAPWNDLIASNALPDTMEIAPFLSHAGRQPATVIALGVALALLLFLFAPRRIALLLPALVLAALTGSSVSASDLISHKVRFDQAAMVGTPRDWVDRATRAPVAYVFAGDPADVNIVWQQRFWNDRVRDVLAFPPYAVTGPLRSSQHAPAPGGRIAVPERYVVANDDLSFVGEPVARQDRGVDYPGLTLWRLDGPPRVATARTGVKPNGDIFSSAQVVAWGCAGGQLQLTLIPKATDDVSVFLGGRRMLAAHIAGLEYWNGTVSVPPATPSPCVFTIHGGLLLGSTRIAFVRA
ncbi:MAG TPA: glycosyltransferase family 39 protein [Gaiellaceae bacterium]